jgi:hypothetical protein
MESFEESFQFAYRKINQDTARYCRMYIKGTNTGFNGQYNQGLLKGHDNDYDEQKQYYQKILECKLRKAKLQWNKHN